MYIYIPRDLLPILLFIHELYNLENADDQTTRARHITTVRLRSLVNFNIKARLNWTRHLGHTVYIALNKKKRISPPKFTYYVE